MGFCEACPIRCCKDEHEEKVDVARQLLVMNNMAYVALNEFEAASWVTTLKYEGQSNDMWKKLLGISEDRTYEIHTAYSRDCPLNPLNNQFAPKKAK